MKKNDWILAGVIVVIAAVVLLFQLTRKNSGEGEVSVSVDGEKFGIYSLTEDRTVDINGTNRLIIENGTARIPPALLLYGCKAVRQPFHRIRIADDDAGIETRNTDAEPERLRFTNIAIFDD